MPAHIIDPSERAKKRFAVRDAHIASWRAESERMERVGRDFDPDHLTAGAIAGFYLHTFGPFALWVFDSTAPPSLAKNNIKEIVRNCIQEAMALPDEEGT